MASYVLTEYEKIANIFIWDIDGALTSTTNQGRGNLRVMAMNGVVDIRQTSKIGATHWDTV